MGYARKLMEFGGNSGKLFAKMFGGVTQVYKDNGKYNHPNEKYTHDAWYKPLPNLPKLRKCNWHFCFVFRFFQGHAKGCEENPLDNLVCRECGWTKRQIVAKRESSTRPCDYERADVHDEGCESEKGYEIVHKCNDQEFDEGRCVCRKYKRIQPLVHFKSHHVMGFRISDDAM